MNIRRANSNDLQTIAKLWWDMHDFNSKYDDRYYETITKEECIKYKFNFLKDLIDNPNHLIWVTENENEIIGYVYVEIIERPPIFKYNRFAKVQEASIKRKYQQKGIFRKNFEVITKELINQNIKLAELEIDLDNPAQMAYWKVKFYKRLIHMICWLED